MGAERTDIHGTVISVLKLYLFPVRLAQLDLERFQFDFRHRFHNHLDDVRNLAQLVI
jgi:hypothetical protein